MMDLKRIISNSENILLSEFGIKPEKSKFITHSKDMWYDFLKKRNLDSGAQGVYLPRSLSAHIDKDSKYSLVNLLHEFFGHGLFCEYSKLGKNVVSLEQSLAKIEKEISCLDDDIKNNYMYEQYISKKKKLQSFFQKNINNYEGFAMWMEHFLSKEINQENLFEEKMNKIVHPEYKKLFEQFLSFSDNYGNFALIAQSGLSKYYDNKTLRETLRKLYKEDFESIKLAILYGSKKPDSDIDLFIVSDNIKPSYNSWLDIYSMDSKSLENDISNLSIAVTDPLFSGEVIIGSKSYQNRLQNKILNQPIINEALSYNIKQSKNQEKIAKMYPKNSKERKIASSYQKSFKKNYEELKNGNKILTLKESPNFI